MKAAYSFHFLFPFHAGKKDLGKIHIQIQPAELSSIDGSMSPHESIIFAVGEAPMPDGMTLCTRSCLWVILTCGIGPMYQPYTPHWLCATHLQGKCRTWEGSIFIYCLVSVLVLTSASPITTAFWQ